MDFPYHDKKWFLSVAPPYLQLAPRWFRGTVRTEDGYLLTGVFQGSLLLSTPGQPSLFMLASALCLIISPNRVNASRLCQSRPVTGFIARRKEFLRVMAHTARMLACPGGCPYCWYALFKEQRGVNIQCPSLSLPDNRGVDKGNPKNILYAPLYGADSALKSCSQRGNACQGFAAHDKMKPKLGGVAP